MITSDWVEYSQLVLDEYCDIRLSTTIDCRSVVELKDLRSEWQTRFTKRYCIAYCSTCWDPPSFSIKIGNAYYSNNYLCCRCHLYYKTQLDVLAYLWISTNSIQMLFLKHFFHRSWPPNDMSYKRPATTSITYLTHYDQCVYFNYATWSQMTIHLRRGNTCEIVSCALVHITCNCKRLATACDVYSALRITI